MEKGAVRTDLSASIGIALLVLVLAPGAAFAQAFVSPLIGYNFGGDSGCPEVTDCEDKNLNIGVSVGSLGSVVGSELDFGYAKNFFGDIPGVSSSVLTLMGNVMLAPRFGIVQPYGLMGLGLIKTHVEASPASVLESNNNHFGWDVGGGLIIYLSEHVGLRGEIRHYHAFQDLEVLGIGIADAKIDFGRAAGGLVFRF